MLADFSAWLEQGGTSQEYHPGKAKYDTAWYADCFVHGLIIRNNTVRAV